MQKKRDYNRPSEFRFTPDTLSAFLSLPYEKENLSTTAVSAEEVRNISKWRKAGSRLPHAETELWIHHIFWHRHNIQLREFFLNRLQRVIQSVDLAVSHSFFLSPSRTPKVNIVLPLSSVWQDKADKRWSHVSTSHNRRNRGRARRAVEAEGRQHRNK